MTFKGTITSLPKHWLSPHLVSALLLLAFSEISSTHVLEKPANGTRPTTDDFGIPQRISNASAESRAPKLLSRFDASRKVDPYIGYWNVSNNGNYSTIRAHSPNLNRTEMKNSTLLDAFLNRRYNSQQKYPNGHITIFQSETGRQQDKRKSYATSEDYEHQVHNIATEYFPPQTQEYDESYNTIPEDMNTGYDVPVTPVTPGYEPWRVSYVPHDPGYFGPPIGPIPVGEPPVHRDPPSTISTRECNCPTTTRSYECDNPSGNFLALVSALGQNLWALISLIATSSVPFLIPLLALKMIIVPLKILKFLKLIKLFLKLFIILPFFVRVVYPALTNSFNLQNFLFQKIQDVFPDDNSHHPPHPHDAESRQGDGKNSTTVFARDDRLLVDDASVWDLRECPSRVACEMGAFLAGASRASFPQNLANYLARRADRAMKSRSKKDADDDEEEDDDEEDEAEDQRDQAFKAFLVALGKKWTQEQCQVYSCAVLF